MQDKPKGSKKQPVNVSIDSELVKEAKAAGLNLSAVLEESLSEKLRERRWQAWRERNRKAIEVNNADVEKNGLLSDKYRTW